MPVLAGKDRKAPHELCLKLFKTRKDLLAKLGMPNKLGIMLHGPPGTGKTSTIEAVAEYLCKDIYYIDLKDAWSNEDLKLMFDHVYRGEGGIIVMEDVDAMTDVVKERKPDRPDVVPRSFTLDYMLNLLQGSLTTDGTIFIATTIHIEVLDSAFVRDGRFDVKIELSHCDHYQITKIHESFCSASSTSIRCPHPRNSCLISCDSSYVKRATKTSSSKGSAAM